MRNARTEVKVVLIAAADHQQARRVIGEVLLESRLHADGVGDGDRFDTIEPDVAETVAHGGEIHVRISGRSVATVEVLRSSEVGQDRLVHGDDPQTAVELECPCGRDGEEGRRVAGAVDRDGDVRAGRCGRRVGAHYDEWTDGPFDQLRAGGAQQHGDRLGPVVARQAQHVAFLACDAEQYTDRVWIDTHIDVLGVEPCALGVVVHVIVRQCEFGVAASDADDGEASRRRHTASSAPIGSAPAAKGDPSSGMTMVSNTMDPFSGGQRSAPSNSPALVSVRSWTTLAKAILWLTTENGDVDDT